jgi:competence protein ComGC
MLIVLFIIGALLLIILPNITRSGVDAQEKACQANINILQAQVENYYLDHQHQYPSEIQDLVHEKYLKKIPTCPLDPDNDKAYQISNGQVRCTLHDNLSNGGGGGA